MINSAGQERVSVLYPGHLFADSIANELQMGIEAYVASGDIELLEQLFQLTALKQAAEIREAFSEVMHEGFLNIPDSLLRREQELIGAIRDVNSDIAEKDDAGSMLLLSKKQELQMEMVKLKRIIEVFYPKYYEIKYGQKIYPVHEIRKILPPAAAILNYVVVGSQYYLFYLDRIAIRLFHIGTAQQIDQMVLQFFEQISDFHPSTTRVDAAIDFNKLAFPLHNALISPAKHLLKNKELIIFPDHLLCLLPFELLVSSPTELDFRKMGFLMQDHAISYNYSVPLWVHALKTKPGFVKGNLISYIPDNGPDQWINGAEIYEDANGSRHEVREILKIVQGRYFDRDHATEKWFRQRTADYRLIHIGLPS
ncbi:MAG: CHAT domain-containing protein, partial [Bacteroidales bacterium]